MSTLSVLRERPVGTRVLVVASLLFLIALPTGSFVYNGLSLLLALVGLGLLAVRREQLWRLDAVKTLGLVFACFWVPMMLALTDAHDISRSLEKSLLYLRFGLGSVVIVYTLLDPALLRLARLVLLAVVTFWVADAGLQLVTGADLFGYPYAGAQLRGVFHPNLRLGLVLAVFTPLVLDEVIARRRWYWWALVPAVPCVIALTLHRNSWLMFALGCLLYLAFRIRDRGFRPPLRVWLAMGVAPIIVAALVLQNPTVRARLEFSVVSAAQSPQALEASLGQRPDIWRTALAMYADNWVNGLGVRGFRGAYTDYASADDYWLAHSPPIVPSHPHQLILEVLAETGTVGLIGYLLAFVLLFRRYLQLDGAGRARAGPWLLCLVIAAFPLNIHKAFYGHFIATLVWWLIAVTVAAMYAHDARQRPPRSPTT